MPFRRSAVSVKSRNADTEEIASLTARPEVSREARDFRGETHVILIHRSGMLLLIRVSIRSILSERSERENTRGSSHKSGNSWKRQPILQVLRTLKR